MARLRPSKPPLTATASATRLRLLPTAHRSPNRHRQRAAATGPRTSLRGTLCLPQVAFSGRSVEVGYVNREYHRWYSQRLNREMELLVHGHAGAPVLVFPTSQGRFFEYEDRGMVATLGDFLENGWFQLYCVDSVDAESFYNWWTHPVNRIQRHLQ